MPTYSRVEIGVGIFVLLGMAALAYLSISLGEVRWFQSPQLRIDARFSSVGDLKEGAAVKMAGVRVGQVDSITLQNYAAEVVLSVQPDLALPKDTIASIRTSGLLGESHISLSPGADEANLAAGDRIMQTEPPIDLIELVSKYAFGSANEVDEPAGGGASAADPFGLD